MKTIVGTVCMLLFIFTQAAYAQTPTKLIKNNVNVSAKIGEFYLNISGIIAPYASLSLLSDGNVYRATTADGQGRFSFSQILIQRGFSNFCIDAVDVKRLGESYTCFFVTPATADITINDSFLPPTLGLNHKEVVEGSDVIISGYSMPGAQVKVAISDGKYVLIKADNTGYYSYTIKNVAKGSYQLLAGATYEGRESLLPSRKIVLKAVEWAEYWSNIWQQIVKWVMNLGPLLLLLLLICLVIFRVWSEPILVFLHLKSKKLHHAWFIGY
jgi:hypothetical protein